MAGKSATNKAIKKIPLSAGSPPRSAAGEYLAILLVTGAIFLALCLVSYDPRDPSFNVATTRSEIANVCGLVGSHIADAMAQMLGISSLLIPVGFAIFAAGFFWPGRVPVRRSELFSTLLLAVIFSGLLERFAVGPVLKFPDQHPGGAVGAFVHASFVKFLGSGGELLLCLALILLGILHLSKISIKRVAVYARPATTILVRWLVAGWASVKAAYSEHTGQTPVRTLSSDVQVQEEYQVCDDPVEQAAWEPIKPEPRLAPKDDNNASRESEQGHGDNLDTRQVPAAMRFGWKPLGISDAAVSPQAMEDAIEEYLKDTHPKGNGASKIPSAENAQESLRPIRVTRRADEDIQRRDVKATNASNRDDYILPPLDLLDVPPASSRSIDERLMEQNAAILEQKLADLGVQGQVVEIHPGPVITMFELTLASGIPLRKVLNMSDDLAMALKSGSTRVVAPIPGKDTVGIEVPNLNREIVYFREIVESPSFMDSDAALKVALGKNIDGEPFATSLTRMPHLLIAGATGTGKSVGLNCLICSWLMSCHPDDVKFIMVDPKKLELSYYQDIPHLLHPVVTEADKVPKVLSWAIREMERRYDLLSNAGAKNIEGYNEMILNVKLNADAEAPPAEKLPYLVIIVDELAELMMVAAKDIEISIARLAQMARASGIHLILATQRPSVDVITGVIKANFPARLSFQVSAKPDSRTILDTTGAEHLLGMGDMLFLPPGTSKMRRLHGAYVSENEIRRVVDFIRTQRSPVYLQEITKHVSEEESTIPLDVIEDVKYDEAVELVTRLGHASISLIQRHMRIGYNRAARIIEAMESEGLIGPSDGTSRPREVLARSLAQIPDR
ncbi:MAG TPA: DNA translocase FtsK 4TM domain-containing protein [Desulfomonilaceae bacterium]|nr:DNA translocase FtsK 4TM domain-containing protein [Desulfomonilaceae bacterium]